MRSWKYTIPLLLLPLIIGTVLRLTGIHHGWPDMVYHPDVTKQTTVAIRTCNNNITARRIFKQDFHRSLYPYGTAILTAKIIKAVTKIKGNKDLIIVHRWKWAVYMRYLANTMFMLAAIFATWFLWQKTGLIPALLASLLLVTEPINSQYSHYAMNDVPLTAVLITIWILSSLMETERKYIPVFSLLCGFTLGIAFNIKYQAIIGGIFPFVAWILLTRKKSWKWLIASIACVAIGGIIGLLWTNPLLRREPIYFFQVLPEFMHWQANILEEKIALKTKLTRNIILFIQYLSITGTFLFMAGPIWGIYTIIKKKLNDTDRIAIISATAFCIIMTLIFIVSRDFFRENDLIPILSFCILLTAFLLAKIIPEKITPLKKNIPALIIYTLTSLSILSFIATSLLDSRALARPDTRIRASRWCQENIPENSKVIRERYTTSINKDHVKEIRCRYIRNHNKNADFLITSSKAYNRFYDKHSAFYDEKFQEVYDYLNAYWKKAKVFQDRELYFAHPTITIFENPKRLEKSIQIKN